MAFVDHYRILGLPTGEEGTRLSERQIATAFKAKALKVHPDKRPAGEAATASREFNKLKQSYEVLMDAWKRRRFDAALLARIRLQRFHNRFARNDDPDREEEEESTEIVPSGVDSFVREVGLTFGVSLACSLAVALAFGLAAARASVSVR